MKYVTELVEVLLGIVIFGALFPVINTALSSTGLDNITLFGTSYDFSWVGYIIVLALVIGLLYFGFKQIKKAK